MSQPLPFLLAQPAALFGAEAAPVPQSLVPDGTVSVTDWTPDGAASVHAALAAADAAFAWSTSNGAVAVVSLTDPVPALSPLLTGTLRVRVRRT